MTKEKVLINIIDAATSILLGADKAPGMEGFSIIADWRIRNLANAIKEGRNAMGLNDPKKPTP